MTHAIRAAVPAHLQQYVDAGLYADVTISDLAATRARSCGGGTAFIDGDRTLSFAQCHAMGDALALVMREKGLVAGDVVSFLLPNWHEAAIVNLAAARLGLVVMPIVPIYRHAEIGHMLRDSGTRMIFTAGMFRGFDHHRMIEELQPSLPDLERIVPVRSGPPGEDFDAMLAAGMGRPFDAPAIDPNAVKLRLYTSGTTGLPKAVLHNHNALHRVIDICWERWGAAQGDAIIMPTPVTHISGYSNGLELPFVAGTCTILMESWKAEVAVGLIDRHAVVGTVGATPFLAELVSAARNAGSNLESFRVFACGGASVPPVLVENANAALAHPCAFRVYGSSETPLTTLGFRPGDPARRDSRTDGEVVDYEVRIVDDEGADVPAGQEGEIIVRGPTMFMGYADPAQTREAMIVGGWFLTGDMGRLDTDRSITVTGRKKDLIIRGGENLSAREIEEALERHPDIAEAAVVAMPHPRLGEGVCAVIVPQGKARPEVPILGAHLERLGLAKQKWPERIIWVAELPRTASGKIRKDVLRRQVADDGSERCRDFGG